MRRSKIIVPLHLVWRTKNNDPWIETAIERRLHRAIVSEAVGLDAQVLAINGTENHVHLAILFPATVRLSDFVKQLKGVSSRLATTELLNRRVYWQEGYGAFAFHIGLTPRVTSYIQQQKEHHRTKTNLWPALEADDEETPFPSSGGRSARSALSESISNHSKRIG